MDYYQWAAETVKELRTRQGWTQAQLAHQSGVNISTINALERQRFRLTLDTIGVILKALGKELVLTIDDDPIPPGYVLVKQEFLNRALLGATEAKSMAILMLKNGRGEK